MDNVLSDIKIAKNGYTTMLWYTRYTTIDHAFGVDFYIDRMPYGMKISECSESLTLHHQTGKKEN